MVSTEASRALGIGAAIGGISQAAESNEPIAPIGIVAVAPGNGFVEIFRSLNAGKVITAAKR
jgi:hypothetical protein